MHESASTPASSAAARWRAHIAAHERSGQTVSEYCATHGVKSQKFYDWRRRLAMRPPSPRFVPVRVTTPVADASDDAGVELLLPGGLRVRLSSGFDQDVLRAAIAALAGVGGRPC